MAQSRPKSISLILVVLDNFPEVGLLEPCLPKSANIRTLVTTRRRDLRHPNVPLGLLSTAEGIDLLNGGERQFGTDAIKLVEALRGLPLALELARNFLNLRPDLTVDVLLEEMAELGEIKTLAVFEDHYHDQLPTGHEKAVGATFQLSWELASPEAQRVLMLMALWAPVSVPRRLLRRALGDAAKSLLTDPLETAIAELARLSLIELDQDSGPRLHRLLGAFVALRIPDGDGLRQTAVDGVRAELSRVADDGDTRSYAELEAILPHAERLLEAAWVRLEDASTIANHMRWQHLRQGRYRLAEQFARQAFSLAQAAWEPDHPNIAICQSLLAMVLQDLGALAEARDLLRRVLAADKRSFEPGHPRIATLQSNLASVLHDLGDLEAARELLRQALTADERNFEPGHPRIAISQSNLALVLHDLGELAEARELLQAAYASLLGKLGPDHPNTQTVRKNLAAVEAAIVGLE